MKIIQLEYARAIAALLVVCFHIEITFAREKYMGLSTASVFSSGDSGVQIFFVLSGFVIYLAHRKENSGSLTAVLEFCRRRFVRVAVPLWIVLSVLTLGAAAGLVPTNASFGDYVRAFAIVPSGSEPVLSVEWTLRHEMVFYAFFALFIFNRKIGGWSLLVWGVSGLVFGSSVDPASPWRIVLSTNNVLFLFGIAICYLHLSGFTRSKGGVGMLGLATFSATGFACLFQVMPKDVSNVLYGMGAAMLLFSAVSTPSLASQNKLLLSIASSSYSLYLIHFPLVSILSKAFTKLGGYDQLLTRIAYFACTLLACIVCAIAFHRFVERPIVTFLNARTGVK